MGNLCCLLPKIPGTKKTGDSKKLEQTEQENRLRVLERDWSHKAQALETTNQNLHHSKTRMEILEEQNLKLHEELLASQQVIRKSLSQVERYRKRAREYYQDHQELMTLTKNEGAGERIIQTMRRNEDKCQGGRRTSHQIGRRRNHRRRHAMNLGGSETNESDPRILLRRGSISYETSCMPPPLPIIMLDGTMGPVLPSPGGSSTVRTNDPQPASPRTETESDSQLDQQIGFRVKDSQSISKDRENRSLSSSQDSSDSSQEATDHSQSISLSSSSRSEFESDSEEAENTEKWIEIHVSNKSQEDQAITQGTASVSYSELNTSKGLPEAKSPKSDKHLADPETDSVSQGKKTPRLGTAKTPDEFIEQLTKI